MRAMRQKTVQWTVLAWSQMECWEINTKHYWSWIPASRSVTERRGFKAYSATAARHEAGENRVEIAHEVEVVPGSKLAELLSARRVGVNSFHHQAAKRIGEGLTVSATSPDGIVEGLEMRDRTFVVAVQWHPENFWKTSPVFDGLFTGFVEAARRAALSRRSPRSS